MCIQKREIFGGEEGKTRSGKGMRNWLVVDVKCNNSNNNKIDELQLSPKKDTGRERGLESSFG